MFKGMRLGWVVYTALLGATVTFWPYVQHAHEHPWIWPMLGATATVSAYCWGWLDHKNHGQCHKCDLRTERYK